MRRCIAQPTQPPLTIEKQRAGQDLHMGGTTVHGLRNADKDLQQDNRLHMGQRLERDFASQRPK